LAGLEGFEFMKKNCVICGKEFEQTPKPKGHGGTQKYCSESCKRERNNAYSISKWRNEHPIKKKKCCFCLKAFTPKSHQLNRRRYCSDFCTTKAKSLYQLEWIKERIRVNPDYLKKYNPKAKHRARLRLASMGNLEKKREKAIQRRWRIKNKGKILEARERFKNSDTYIAHVILRIPKSICPPALIACKRAHIQLRRLLKDQTPCPK
jgi:hypothetical protein